MKRPQLLTFAVPLATVAVFFANFIAFGCGNSFAVFYRAYLAPTSPFADAGTFRLGFIGGTSVGFAFLMGPLANVRRRCRSACKFAYLPY